MIRAILAFIVGLAVWVLVASLLNRGLRLGLEGYAAAEPQMVHARDDGGPPRARRSCIAGRRRGHKGHRAFERAFIVDPRCIPARGVHPGARSTLGEVSGLVSPCVPGNSRTACCTRGDAHSKPFAYRNSLGPSVANLVFTLHQAACIGTRCDVAKLDVVRQWTK